MKNILMIFVFLSASNVSFAGNKQALSYGVLTRKGFCSSTLIKVGGKCHFVTNAHCLAEGESEVLLKSASDYLPDFNSKMANFQEGHQLPKKFKSSNSVNNDFLWRYERAFFSEKEKSPMKSKVLYFDRTKDLALLEVPAEVERGACKEVLNLWMVDGKSLEEKQRSVVLAGFTTNQNGRKPHAKVWHTRGTRFNFNDSRNPVYQPSNIEMETSTLENVEKFLVADNIKMLPGNSGGAAFDDRGLFLGVTTRFHATQDKVYIIPSADVVDYILAPTQNGESGESSNKSQPTGGNGGTDGGGNGGVDGGGCENNTSSLDPFVEPHEGYLSQFGKIILAVDGHQIDGSDDMKDHYTEEGELITRDVDGYPAFAFRKGIISRIKGEFEFESVSKGYDVDKEHVQGWKEMTYGEGSTSIKITDEEIELTLGGHLSLLADAPFSPGYASVGESNKKISFKISQSADYKTIHLTRGNEKLECDNRNYLKLICKGSESSFSLSLDSVHGKANFRLLEDRSKIGKNYFFGAQ